jgi:ABC-2 type transport system permease protein
MTRTVRDTLLIFQRQMRMSLRSPAWIIIGLIQPVLYLVFFAPMLIAISHVRGFPPGSAWQVFVPGLLVQLGLFGATFVGFGIIAEWRSGVLERLRVTPASRIALLLGRVLRDTVVLFVQSVLLTLAAVALGLRAPVAGLLIDLCFVLFLAVSLASLSYAASLVTKREDTLARLVNSIVVPLLLLSGILIPMSLAPTWLGDLSRANPLRYVVQAMRQVVLGHYASADVMWGAVVVVLLSVISVTTGVAVFRRESA